MNEDEITVSAWPAALVIKMRLRAGVEQEFSSWHATMSTLAVDLPGFISAEVNAPVPPSQPEWRIIQYFRSADQLHAWRESEPHRCLLLEANALVEANGTLGLVEEETAEVHADGTVTEVITTYVKPDKIRDYQAWAARIHQAEAQFPGYRGGFLQPPPSAKQPFWTKLVRFATPEQLDAWLNSSARQGLLREHDALVSSWESHRLPTSFAGWFPSHHTTGASPPAWKQSMLVVLVRFPIVMMELRFRSPLRQWTARSREHLHWARHQRRADRLAVHATRDQGMALVGAPSAGKRQMDKPDRHRVVGGVVGHRDRGLLASALLRRQAPNRRISRPSLISTPAPPPSATTASLFAARRCSAPAR